MTAPAPPVEEWVIRRPEDDDEPDSPPPVREMPKWRRVYPSDFVVGRA